MKRYFTFDRKLNLKSGREQRFLFPTKKSVKTDNLLLAKYSSIGYYLVTPLLFGVFLGLYLGKITRKDYFVIAGIVVGGIGTFYNLIRLLK